MGKKDITTQIYNLLDETAAYIEHTTWHTKYSLALKSLQEELKAPCVLAVAGKVKAGKSFLVNALLGVDIAMTGTTETTATVNIFKKVHLHLKKNQFYACFLMDIRNGFPSIIWILFKVQVKNLWKNGHN